jgi:hypothetical protein
MDWSDIAIWRPGIKRSSMSIGSISLRVLQVGRDFVRRMIVSLRQSQKLASFSRSILDNAWPTLVDLYSEIEAVFELSRYFYG